MFSLFLSAAFILFPLISISQEFVGTDSTIKKNSVKFIFGFDGRRSFVGDQNVNIGGIRLGIQYKEKFRTGIGFYGSDSPIVGSKRFNENTQRDKRLRGKLIFGYSGVFFEPIFLKNKKWELAMPLTLGFGNATLTFYNPDSTVFSENGKSFSLVELSGTVEYKFLKWAGVGAGLGYRTVFSDEPFIKDNFNAPIYIIKIKIFIGELYRGIKKTRQKKKALKNISD